MKFTSQGLSQYTCEELGSSAMLTVLVDVLKRLEALEAESNHTQPVKQEPLYSNRIGDLELRKWDISRPLEIVFWHCPAKNHPLCNVESPNPFCFMLASWTERKGGPQLEFCGKRVFEYLVNDRDCEIFWGLAKAGQEMAEKAYSEKDA